MEGLEGEGGRGVGGGDEHDLLFFWVCEALAHFLAPEVVDDFVGCGRKISRTLLQA